MKYSKLVFTAFILVFVSTFAFAGGHSKKSVLIVVTNHSELGNTGERTGYFLAEVAHPWHVFKEAGYSVEFASPKGGFAPMDPKSFDLDDPINKKLWHDLKVVENLVHTQALPSIDLSKYSAIFFAGGHGTMWDFPDDESVIAAVRNFVESDRPVGAVCHGPAALVNVTLSDGTHLLEGRRVNGFTNEEEEAVNLTEEMPFLLETKMREAGGKFTESDLWQPHVAVGGVVVTGQNPASASKAAETIVEMLDGDSE